MLPPALPQEEQKVSKKIHQIIWDIKDIENKPEILENIERLKALNPGWEYRLWTEEDVKPFLMEYYGQEVYEAFYRIEPNYLSPRSDLFRYLVILVEGGVYLDIKSSISKPIDDYLLDSDRMLVAYWDKHAGVQEEFKRESPEEPCGLLMTWCVIASAGHPLIREVLLNILYNIDRYNPYTHGVGVVGAFRVGGPELYTDIVLKNRQKYADILRFIFLIQEWGGVFTVYKEVSIHQKAFTNNYRAQRTPLVWNVSPLGKTLFSPIFALRTWWYRRTNK